VFKNKVPLRDYVKVLFTKKMGSGKEMQSMLSEAIRGSLPLAIGGLSDVYSIVYLDGETGKE
jgi:hypothetical protein